MDKKLEDIKFEKDDFQLTERKVIRDSSLDTPPSTFLKDAFKRFVKNKSSVTAAIILALLIIGSFLVPVVSSHDTIERNGQTLLIPKLFDAGTGFYDGTKKIKGQIYDTVNETPLSESYSAKAIVPGTLVLTNEGDNFVNAPTNGAYGGTITLQNTKEEVTYFRNRNTFDFTQTDELKVTLKFNDQLDYLGTLGEFRVVLTYSYLDGSVTKNDTVVLQDWSTNHNEVTLDLSNSLAAGVNSATKAQVNIELKNNANATTYFALSQLLFTVADATTPEQKAFFNELSITDANATALLKASGGIYPTGFWDTNNERSIDSANIIYCTFTYDFYEAAFGEYQSDISQFVMQGYIDQKLCTYDFNVGPSSFVILDDSCPVREVKSQDSLTVGSTTIYTLTTSTSKYREVGYDEMPRFLLGTDSKGRDIVVLTFDGLKYSLLLAFVVSAVCFAFGLLWGAIAGYFGGNVDLFMERLRDIISGVPYLVVMTLAILLLGNNFFTFAMALCLTGWIGVAGRTRVQFYRFKGREYVLASRTLGASDKRLIIKHILPNAMGTIITMSILMIPGVIGSESTLSYLGMGIADIDTLGVLLSNNQQYIVSYPPLILFPAFILSLIMISFNLFGNGLRDALNPTLKGSE